MILTSVPAVLSLRPGPLTMATAGKTVTVTDATGSGDGWEVLASVSGGTAELDGFTASCGPGSTCTLPASGLSYPVPVTASTPVLEALPPSGMGTIVYSLDWVADGPVTITISLQAGP